MNCSTRLLRYGAAASALLLFACLPPSPRALARAGEDGATRPAESAAVAAVSAVTHVGIVVSDLDAALAFYTSVLTFEKVSEVERAGEEFERSAGVFGARCRVARLRLGEEYIELLQYLAPEGRPIPVDSRSNDRWFQHIAIVVSDMDQAYARLRQAKVRHVSAGPQTLPDWNPNAGGIAAFYFKDPDRHVLEVIEFPPGKGDPRWHEPTDKLFLGIDHTAIVVDDTDTSLSFYRDVLGMRIASASENHGIEQERLNNVFGARLRITALRAEEGPGIEFLEYLAPGDGRPSPIDARSNDLIGWTTTLVAPSAEEMEQRLREMPGGISWVSPGFVEGTGERDRSQLIARIRDPDGHMLVLVGAGETE